jgi:hypothetical protein
MPLAFQAKQRQSRMVDILGHCCAFAKAAGLLAYREFTRLSRGRMIWARWAVHGYAVMTQVMNQGTTP